MLCSIHPVKNNEQLMSLIKIHGYVLQLLLIKENSTFTTASSLDGVCPTQQVLCSSKFILVWKKINTGPSKTLLPESPTSIFI